jgi:hypothetical protein
MVAPIGALKKIFMTLYDRCLSHLLTLRLMLADSRISATHGFDEIDRPYRVR